jgi:hypothetical protein
VVPKQPFAIAATAVVCLLITTGAGSAQQRYYPQQRQTSATLPGTYQYQYQSPATVVGTYKSDTFHPSPLVLNITGMDASGNLTGSMWGMETRPQNGEDPAWQYWHRVFGRDARGVHRGGRLYITFSNGASYTLDVRGGELSGTFASKTSNYPVSFLKSSSGVAAR